MARAAKAIETIKSTPADRKPGRPAKAQPVKPPPKAARITKAAVRTPAAPPAPKMTISKDELRAQVEKLELVVATLRAKSREANRAAKTASARVAELEAQVAKLEKKAAAAPAPAPMQNAKAPTPRRNQRRSRDIDPGEAVPPGVAVLEAEPMDAEAETALENLEEHLGHT